VTRFACLVVLCLAVHARAQTPAPVAPAPAPAAPPKQPAQPVTDDGTLHPAHADRATCLLLDTTPGALVESTPTTDQLATPIPWSAFVVAGTFLPGDSKDTLHALLEATFNEHRTNFTAATWPSVAAVAAKYGYQVVGHLVTDAKQGAQLTLSVAPLPLVRKVRATVDSGFGDKILDEEVARRLRVRPGGYLPWEPVRRECALGDERDRIEEYLHEEGYADAVVRIEPETSDLDAIELRVRVDLGAKYITGLVRVVNLTPADRLGISAKDIANEFHHQDNCYPLINCVTSARFTRTKMQEDLQRVRDRFHKLGYLTARVTSSFEPQISFDRRTHTVNFTVTVDQRRFTDVKFEGTDISADELKQQLTFAAAGSTDEVEVQTSARALSSFLQARGFFDARVTWDRQRLPNADLITFQIDSGPTREVASVSFVGEKALDEATLAKVVAAKPGGSLFGAGTAVTAASLEADRQAVATLYRRAGYRDATVTVTASTTPAGRADAALTAALVLADHGRDLHVRFVIDEGVPTILSGIDIDFQAEGNERTELCGKVLTKLASTLSTPAIATRDPARPDTCAPVAKLKYREEDIAATADVVRDLLYELGRPRAQVDLELEPDGPQRMVAHYKLRRLDAVRVGKIVVRGNFKTRTSVIRDLLDLHEGALLTRNSRDKGIQKLRSTGLFDAVNIEFPDLCGADATAKACPSSAAVVNGVVRVEEHFDHFADVELFAGDSTYQGLYGGATLAMRNILGRGIVLSVTGTVGTKILEAEAQLQFPEWLWPIPVWIPFRTDFTGLLRQQDTPRFGLLTTKGLSVGFTHQWSRQRTPGVDARVLTFNVRYDFRLRTREVDALRPIGGDQDGSQVAVSTRTSTAGATFVYDQRVDRLGNLAPLSPDGGFMFEVGGAFAEDLLFGQDTFIKLSGSVSKFQSIGDSWLLRGDLRFDWGIPLGGAVLLPEVERFFAGGDSTVRGYSDDRLATELIQVGVPPIGANLTQIRIIPAGGNIRGLASLDAQYKVLPIPIGVLAGAAFSDLGMITNTFAGTKFDDFRPSVGMGLRALTPVGVGAIEYAVPLRPQLGDDPRGRIHFYFAARAQF